MDRRLTYGFGRDTCKKKLCPVNSTESKEAARERLKELRKIYIDGSEQPIRRPKNNIDQKENYSGKKKTHTSKAVIITGPDKSVEVISPVYVGSTHDFSVFKEENMKDILPLKTPIYIDTGFEGINNICPEQNIKKPKKKPKGKDLNGGEKLGNRIISKERVKVEHSIGGIKKFKIASDRFRGINQTMDNILKVTCGLFNLQIYAKSV